MEIRLIEALILLITACSTAITIWNNRKLQEVGKDVDGKLAQLIDARQSASFLGGREAERKDIRERGSEHPPLP